MKKTKIIKAMVFILISAIVVFGIPIASISGGPMNGNGVFIPLDEKYLDSQGYICGTDMHWVKFELPDEIVEDGVNEGPFKFEVCQPWTTWKPTYFVCGESEIKRIEFKTLSGHYAEFSYDTQSGSNGPIPVDVCDWLTSWENKKFMELFPEGFVGPCCYHVDWIIIWYTGENMSCRTHEMTCWQVWINEDNNFEFIFWWEYYNNNWVQIFDMEDNLVWEIDFPKGKPRFEVDLPDGMYKVQTFHEAGKILQEFIIGKPGPEM